MSDSIRVRVVLDSYDFAHPGEKQTAVHVQIPEVARATYMLPAERFAGLKDREWPEVLDVAHEHYERGWAVTDSVSASARAAVRAWLLDPTNRDEMQAEWEEDRARRDPLVRTLRARVAELEAAGVAAVSRLQAMQSTEWNHARVAGLDSVIVLLAPTQTGGAS